MRGEEGSGGTGTWCARALIPMREICYLSVLGLTSMPLAHDTGTVSLLGYPAWSGIGANCHERRKCGKAVHILEEVKSRFGEDGRPKCCCVVK